MSTHPKSTNICIVQESGTYTLSYIDDTDAIRVGQEGPKLGGTVGYYAPEFFKGPHTDDFFAFLEWQRQCCDDRTLLEQFKENFEQQFSQSSDVYALGCVILDDVELPKESRWYDLARQMCETDSTQRPYLTALDLTCTHIMQRP